MKSKSAPPLREGFSTGTAAAAAAAAAVAVLCGLKAPQSLFVALPPFVTRKGRLLPEDERRLLVPIAAAALAADGTGLASVIKDGGDDPDATHGARITVQASFEPFTALKAPPLRLDAFDGPVFLYAGTGVGVATLPGLPLAVGEAAINPEPRRQIAYAARESAARAAAAHSTGLDAAVPHAATPYGAALNAAALHLLISVPDGELRARRTLNARLGIEGGLSILGTRGIVRPYSHEAWQCALSQALAVAGALGFKEVMLCTGRRSERLGRALLPHLPERSSIQAADFAAHGVRQAAGHNFARLHWVCFPGKLLKVAQGLEWTHARSGAADLALLGRLCREAGNGARPDWNDIEDGEDLAALPTASGVLAWLEPRPDLHRAVLGSLADLAFKILRRWLDEAGGQDTQLLLHVFSLEGRHLLSLPDSLDIEEERDLPYG